MARGAAVDAASEGTSLGVRLTGRPLVRRMPDLDAQPPRHAGRAQCQCPVVPCRRALCSGGRGGRKAAADPRRHEARLRRTAAVLLRAAGGDGTGEDRESLRAGAEAGARRDDQDRLFPAQCDLPCGLERAFRRPGTPGHRHAVPSRAAVPAAGEDQRAGGRHGAGRCSIARAIFPIRPILPPGTCRTR